MHKHIHRQLKSASMSYILHFLVQSIAFFLIISVIRLDTILCIPNIKSNDKYMLNKIPLMNIYLLHLANNSLRSLHYIILITSHTYLMDKN